MLQLYTQENFEQEVLKSSLPVLVYFGAHWCLPCQAFFPVVQEMDEESDGNYKVGYIDVDGSKELAQKYRIDAIPSIIIFKNGQPAAQLSGVVTKDNLHHILLSD